MNANLAAMIINITAIICFTVLAVVFSKWWIILFSILFLYSAKRGDK